MSLVDYIPRIVSVSISLMLCHLLCSQVVAQEQGLLKTAPPKLISRLEDDKNFPIPNERAEDVWRVLRRKFKNGFSTNGITFRGVTSIEQFHDEYFDSPDLKLVQHWVSCRHRRRVGERGAKKQLVQVKITPFEGSAPMDEARNERKFRVSGSYQENGPLVERIKNSDRQRFRETMHELGVDPDRLVPSMIIKQERRRVYFRKDDVQYFTATLDIATGNRWPFRPRMTQLEFEISEKVNTVATEDERGALHKLREEIIKAAGIDESITKQDPRPKVVHLFDDIFSRRYGVIAKVYILHPWLFPLGAALTMLGIVVILGVIMPRHRPPGDGRY